MDPTTFHREMAVWLLGQGLVLVGILAGLIRYLWGREEERIAQRIDVSIKTAFERHDDDAEAHGRLVRAWEDRRDRRLDQILLHTGDVITSKLTEAVEKAMTLHNRDPWAHPEGSEQRIAPLRESIAKITETLSSLDKRLVGLDAFIETMRQLKKDHDDVVRRAAENGVPLPKHQGR